MDSDSICISIAQYFHIIYSIVVGISEFDSLIFKSISIHLDVVDDDVGYSRHIYGYKIIMFDKNYISFSDYG